MAAPNHTHHPHCIWRICYIQRVSEKLRKARFATDADIEIKGAYTPTDASGDATSPGQFPFTRGVQATMYRGQLWTMRQYAGFGTAAESNQRYKYLLAQGGKGLSVAFDLPTQMGRDSDHPSSRGEVGRVGVAIDSLDDMRVLFEGIALSDVSTSMTINATASTLLAFYLAVAEDQGASAASLRGTIQNDILKEYIARGTYIYPPPGSMRLITDTFTYCNQHVPQWNTVSISGYHIREAGSDAVQEVAFTLGDGIAYVEAALRSGLAVDEFAPRLSFFFNVHNNFLEEIAKFRAARRMWAHIMRDRFGATNPKSQMLRVHSQTAGVTLQAQQPLVNIARVTLQALASVFGGTQSLHTNSYDEALGLPSEQAAQIALRTQQVIAHESGVADFIDPFAGSWAVEALTDDIERRAHDYLAEIDRLGGMSRRSNADTRNARSSGEPTSTNALWRPNSASWLESMTTLPQTMLPRRFPSWIRSSRSSSARASPLCALDETVRSMAGRLPRSATQQRGPTTSCQRSLAQRERLQRWAKSPTCCASATENFTLPRPKSREPGISACGARCEPPTYSRVCRRFRADGSGRRVVERAPGSLDRCGSGRRARRKVHARCRHRADWRSPSG